MKLFQIYENDLELLESELPAILDANMLSCNDELTRKRWQEIKRIVSDIRWNYGPPSSVEEGEII